MNEITPLNNKRGIPPHDLERFLSKFTERGASDCWIWNGTHGGPYGKFVLAHKSHTAHRLCYELSIGPIPERHHLHHRCNSKDCINPTHFEILTPELHAKEHAARITHCKRGHPFDEPNTAVSPTGVRSCRKCTAWRKSPASRANNPDGPIAPFSKLYCKNGHPLFGDNMVLATNWAGGLYRQCRICNCANVKRYNRTHYEKVRKAKAERRDLVRTARLADRTERIRELVATGASGRLLVDGIARIVNETSLETL